MADIIVKKLNDQNTNEYVQYHYYDLKSDYQLFFIHVGMNAYLKKTVPISFSDHISTILNSFETCIEYDYKTATCVRNLKKVEVGWGLPTNGDINISVDEKSVMRRHLLEYLIDGILHPTIIDCISMVLCSKVKIIPITKDGDFERMTYILNQNRIDILWLTHGNTHKTENKYYLLSDRKLDDFDLIYNEVKNMWLEYCNKTPCAYLLEMLENGNKKLDEKTADNYKRLLQPYHEGTIIFYSNDFLFILSFFFSQSFKSNKTKNTKF
jgi:hypothetical protein